MSALRILHVSDVSIGGVAALLRFFVTAQRDAGQQPRLLAPRPVPGIPEDLVIGWRLDRRSPRTFAAAWLDLRRACRETGADVVHLHAFHAGLFGRVPVRLPSRCAVVYQPHCWNFDAFRGRPAQVVVRAVERYAARHCDVVVVNCPDEAAEGLRERVRTPMRALGLPVDLRRFHPAGAGAGEPVRRRLDVGDRRIVTSVGALCWQKGQDRLVAAWERSPVPNAHLVLVGGGEGPYLRRTTEATLRSLAPTQLGRTITAVGHQDDVRPWLWASDVVVQAVRYESQGLAASEAMACGVPVVTFAVNGARAALEDGSDDAAGAVLPQGDLPGLLAAVRGRLDDASLRAREAAAARRRALQLFRPEDVLQRLDAAYAEALARRPLSTRRGR